MIDSGYRFDLAAIRVALLKSQGLETSRGSGKWSLPKSFSTHPSHIKWDGFYIKCLSVQEARRWSVWSICRPKRILVWDDVCKQWMFIGSFLQHCRTSKTHKRKEVAMIDEGYDRAYGSFLRK